MKHTHQFMVKNTSRLPDPFLYESRRCPSSTFVYTTCPTDLGFQFCVSIDNMFKLQMRIFKIMFNRMLFQHNICDRKGYRRKDEI